MGKILTKLMGRMPWELQHTWKVSGCATKWQPVLRAVFNWKFHLFVQPCARMQKMVNSAQNFQPRTRHHISPIAKQGAKSASQKQDLCYIKLLIMSFGVFLIRLEGSSPGRFDGESHEPGALV